MEDIKAMEAALPAAALDAVTVTLDTHAVGEGVLVLVKGALKSLPMGEFANAVIDAIQKNEKKRKGNSDITKALVDAIHENLENIDSAVKALRNIDEGIAMKFKNAVHRFAEILHGIEEVCKEWEEKKFWKQTWGAAKYNDKLNAFKRNLESYKSDLNIAIQFHKLVIDAGQFKEVKTTLGEVKTTLDRQSLHKEGEGPPESTIPERVTALFGRDKELQQIEVALAKTRTVVALVGAGGMGKSHLAKFFANKWFDEDNRCCFWIAAEKEETARADYFEMLDILHVDLPEEEAKDKTTRDVADLVWTALTHLTYDWMVVLDNVPEVNEGREGTDAFDDWFFPHMASWGNGNGRILITTRCSSFGNHETLKNIKKLELSTLKTEAATEMMLSDLNVTDDDREAAEKLVGKEYFDGLPLAIATANGLIKDQVITVREYLDEMDKNLSTTEKDDKVGLAVKLAIQSVLDHARRTPHLAHALNVAAFLNPDRMQRKLLGYDDGTRKEAVQHLCKLRLLSPVEKEIFSIHRLHQDAAKEGASPYEAILAVNDVMKGFDRRDSSTWHVGLSMLPHDDAIHNWMKRVGYTSCLKSDEEIIAYAESLSWSGGVLSAVQNFLKAQVMFEEALDILRQVYGTNARNVDMASALHDLGSLYDSQGKYDAALEKFIQAHDMKWSVYGADASNADLASTINNIGGIYDSQGKYDAALYKYNHSLDMKWSVYGAHASNEDLASTINNIGFVYCKQGKYDAALENYNQALDMMLDVYGADASNPDLAQSINNIGLVYCNQGKYDAALEKYNHALDMKWSVYGADASNADLAQSILYVGMAYRGQGNYDAAQQNFQQALEMFRHIYGTNANHQDIHYILKCLKSVKEKKGLFGLLGRCRKYTMQGKHDAALQNIQQELEMFMPNYGTNESFKTCKASRHLLLNVSSVYGADASNTDLAWSILNVGMAYRGQGNYDAAQQNFQQAVEMFRDIFGTNANHQDIHYTLKCLKSVKEKKGLFGLLGRGRKGNKARHLTS